MILIQTIAGQAFSYPVAFQQGTQPINCELVNAPSGVTLGAGPRIQGTLYAAGTHNLTLRCVGCNSASDSLAVQIVVTGANDVLPAGFTADQVGPLTFREEFLAPLNTAKWRPQMSYLADDNNNNFQVSNGSLKIWNTQTGQGATSGAWDIGRAFNTGADAWIDTMPRRFEQKYGFFEVDAKLPKGPGNWPAFWLYAHPGNLRPEIDILEWFAISGFLSGNNPVNNAMTVHTGPDGATTAVGTRRLADTFGAIDLSAGFNKFGIKWDATGVEALFNGNSYGRVNVVLTHAMFMILSMGTTSGRAWADAGAEPTTASSRDITNPFEVRSVRAWGLADNSHTVGGTYPNPAA